VTLSASGDVQTAGDVFDERSYINEIDDNTIRGRTLQLHRHGDEPMNAGVVRIDDLPVMDTLRPFSATAQADSWAAWPPPGS
jgi:hypothetical protein